jgi:hypothetical protein
MPPPDGPYPYPPAPVPPARKGLPTPAIIGIVAAGVVVLLCGVCGFFGLVGSLSDKGGAKLAAASTAPTTAVADDPTTAEPASPEPTGPQPSSTSPTTEAPPPPPPATTVAAPPPSTDIPGDGVFEIGTDVKPGKYHTAGPSGDNPVGCYYAYTKADGTIVDNNIVNGPATITILSSRVGLSFESSACQTWTKVG